MDTESPINLVIDFKPTSIELTLNPATTFMQLKQIIQNETKILIQNQKILGYRQIDKSISLDDTSLIHLKLPKESTKDGCVHLKLYGTPESDIVSVPEEVPMILDDFELDFWPTDDQIQDYMSRMDNLDRVTRDTEINFINPLDPNKKMLVLDLDKTLFDFSGRKHTHVLEDTMRPGLLEFLEESYKNYNLVIWSATNWRWVEIKLTELGILFNSKFNISFVLDISSMFKVKSIRKGVEYEHSIKPLELIWRRIENFDQTNTIHIDDLSRNFAMNIHNGLKIKPYKYSAQARMTDTELFKLATYLTQIADVPDISALDLTRWDENL